MVASPYINVNPKCTYRFFLLVLHIKIGIVSSQVILSKKANFKKNQQMIFFKLASMQKVK